MKAFLASLLFALMTLVSLPPCQVAPGSFTQGMLWCILAERGRKRRVEDQQYWPNGWFCTRARVFRANAVSFLFVTSCR